MIENQVKTLKEDIEKLTMQLIACSNACFANTNESIKELESNIHEDYKSMSLNDVINTVKKEIALREENARLREALEFYAFNERYVDKCKKERVGYRKEFGCHCCAGIISDSGENDYDREVIGLTAREALGVK